MISPFELGLVRGRGPWTLQRIFVCPISMRDDPVDFESMWRLMVRCRMDLEERVLSEVEPDGRDAGLMVRRLLVDWDWDGVDGRGV